MLDMTDTQKDLGFESFSPVKNIRASYEELVRIKKYSDENLNLIFLRINTEDEEEKRNIIVNLIGALDYYIHEIIIWGLVQITMNKFPKGKNYKNIKISIEYLKESIEKLDVFDNLELKKTIIEEIRTNSYQKWKQIKDGLKIILPDIINDRISNLTDGKNGIKALFQTIELENISNKRHLIVHHFDREYNNDSQRNTVNIDCKKSYELIKIIINSIHNILTEYDETQPEQESL